jgi:hypothetical protein
MSCCANESKVTITGVFAGSDMKARLICRNCLTHIAWQAESKKKDLDESQRIPLGDLLASLTGENASKLSETEKNFVYQLAERFDKYKEKTLISEKQRSWLDGLQVKYKCKAIYNPATAPRGQASTHQVDPTADDIPF